MERPEGYEQAVRAVLKNCPPRYLEIDNLDRYVQGTQYEGRPDWFNATGTPLHERAPCIKYPIVRQAIQSNTDLVLGEGRFPVLTTNPGEDDSGDWGDDDATDAQGYDEEDSAYLDRFIAEVCRRTRFRRACRELFKGAQALKSACAVVGVRAGRVAIDSIKAHWCTPTFDVDGHVVRLEIRYPFLEQYKDRDGRWRVRAMLYRRTIDAVADTTYYPAEAHPDGKEPPWTADPNRTIAHGMGFCPVAWHAHMRECGAVNDYDGHAIHEGALDHVFAHDVALSMRHRSAIMLGDPQPYETGVEPGYNPTGKELRTPRVPATAVGGKPTMPGGGNPVTGAYVAATEIFGTARPKGPAHVWQYPAPDAKVDYLVLPAEVFAPISEHARDMRIKACETLGVVFIDPEHIKFASSLSGKALDALRERQFDRCDAYRDDFGDGMILPLFQMVLRVIMRFDFKLPGIKRARVLLARLTDEAGNFVEPLITLKWPDYTKPDPEEEQQQVLAVTGALTAGACSRRSAVEKLRRIFPIENVDQALAAADGDPGKLAATMAAATKAGLVESETYRREITKRFARAVLPGLDEALAAKIDAEVDAAEVHPVAQPGTLGGPPPPEEPEKDDGAPPGGAGKDKAAA